MLAGVRRFVPACIVAFSLPIPTVACGIIDPIPDLTSGGGSPGDSSVPDSGQPGLGTPDSGQSSGGPDSGGMDSASAGDSTRADTGIVSTDSSTPPPLDAADTSTNADVQAGDSGFVFSCPAGVTYCNTFATPLDLAEFTAMNLDASTTTQGVPGGGSAVQLQYGGGAAPNGIYAYAGAATIPTPTVFLRVFVKFGTTGGTVMFYGPSSYSDGVQTYVGGDGDWHVQQYNGNDMHSGISVFLADWHCVQMQVDLGSAPFVSAWFDGQGPFTVTLATPQLPWDTISFDVDMAEGSAQYADFAFGTQPIGCE